MFFFLIFKALPNFSRSCLPNPWILKVFSFKHLSSHPCLDCYLFWLHQILIFQGLCLWWTQFNITFITYIMKSCNLGEIWNLCYIFFAFLYLLLGKSVRDWWMKTLDGWEELLMLNRNRVNTDFMSGWYIIGHLQPILLFADFYFLLQCYKMEIINIWIMKTPYIFPAKLLIFYT